MKKYASMYDENYFLLSCLSTFSSFLCVTPFFFSCLYLKSTYVAPYNKKICENLCFALRHHKQNLFFQACFFLLFPILFIFIFIFFACWVCMHRYLNFKCSLWSDIKMKYSEIFLITLNFCFSFRAELLV